MAVAAYDAEEEAPEDLDAFFYEDLKLLRAEEDDLVDSMSDPSETPLPLKAVNEEADGSYG